MVVGTANSRCGRASREARIASAAATVGREGFVRTKVKACANLVQTNSVSSNEAATKLLLLLLLPR